MRPELFSLYDKNTQELMFRVYALPCEKEDWTQVKRYQHYAAHDLLGAALLEDFGVRHIQIAREGLEKPKLLHDSLQFNLSHCKGLAVCAVGRGVVGVDAEPPRAVKAKLLETVLTPAERAWLAGQSAPLAFSRLWTLKEAFTKYTGEGIRRPFAKIGFSLENGIAFHGASAEQLAFYQFFRGDDLVISLCVPAGEYRAILHNTAWNCGESGIQKISEEVQAPC